MMEEKKLSEQESLQLIAEMIQKAKYHFHESGTSAILWGGTISFCGLVAFSEAYLNWYIGFDVWWLPMIAVAPQIYISVKEGRNRKVLTYRESALNVIWTAYAISIFALIFYLNVVPWVSDNFMLAEGKHLIQQTATEKLPFHIFVPSTISLFLLLYAIPTLAVGMTCQFRPMVVGAILCYVFFIISCFTSSTFDLLLCGIAAIFNWLVPGLILRRRFLEGKRSLNV